MRKKDSPLKIIAHRCRGFDHKENSIRAIRAALKSKVEGIEVDIRLTKDLKWVVIHDAFYKDEQREVRRVHEHTLSQIKKDVVPLDAVLALFAAFGKNKDIFIDVKDVGEERQLVNMLKRHKVISNTVVIAWEPEILRRIHALNSTIRLGFSYVPIHSSLKKFKTVIHKPLTRKGVLLNFNAMQSFDTRMSIGKIHQHYVSDLPLLPLYSIQVLGLFCSNKLLKKAHAKGLKVIAYTIDKRITAALLRRRGVDMILTNKPKVFIK